MYNQEWFQLTKHAISDKGESNTSITGEASQLQDHRCTKETGSCTAHQGPPRKAGVLLTCHEKSMLAGGLLKG